MSAFLGPIHYWLYNKIQLQQAIVEDIYPLAAKQGLSLKKDMEDRFGILEDKPLEEMIDTGNIHGWLQEKVSQVEYKYAYLVTSLISKNPNTLDELKQVLSNNGKNLGHTLHDTALDAPTLYKVITDYLLDGMPCDHANSVVAQDENEVVFRRNLCVHSDYWDEVGGEIAIYYILRDSWIEGLSKECGFIYSKIDSTTYSIKK